MRAFLWFLAIIVATLLIAALLSYPLFVAVHGSFPAWPFDRVATRLWQLLMLGTLLFVLHHLGLRSARDFGYGAPRPRWLRQLATGLAAGVLTMVPISIAMLLLGIRDVNPELGAAVILKVLRDAALSGLAVGFVEETFFRGLMLGAVVRELRRPALAIALVAAVYASVHFLAGTRIPPEAVTWASGFTLLKGALVHFLAPGSIADAWLALFAVGLLLGACAWWTGNIGVGVGLHAAWVFVMRATIGISHENPQAPLAWLISPMTGFTGWLVLAWTLLVSVAVLLVSQRFRHWHRTL